MRLLKLTLSILSISIFIACGGNSSKEESGSEEETMTSKEIMQQRAQENETSASAATSEEENEKETSTNSDVVELTIEGNDQMRFNKEKMTVKAGQTVKLTLKHVGKMSKQQMGHNWVLLKKGTDIMEFGQKAASHPDNGYIPPAEEDKVITYTETIGGGKETTITFEAPAKGTYDFICSFPGHVSLMQGKFIVE